MVEIKKELTIVDAYRELKGINNRIDVYKTLRNSTYDIKPIKLKEILVSGGRHNNEALLNALVKKDEYTEELYRLYELKNMYERFILEEIERLKGVQQPIIVGFLKDYEKWSWKEIEKVLNYSERQLRRYYDEYKINRS